MEAVAATITLLDIVKLSVSGLLPKSHPEKKDKGEKQAIKVKANFLMIPPI